MSAAAALVVLTGCGAAGDGGAGDGSLTTAGATPLPTEASPAPSSPAPLPSSPLPTPASSPPTPTSVPAAAGPLVVFSRSGGIAGRQVTLTVQPDGHATLVGARQADWTLSPGQLDGLRRALEDADLRAVAPTGEPVLDGYSYRVTYGGRTVLLSGNALSDGAATVVDKLSTLAEGP